MPRDVVIQGVLLPAAAATAFVLASLVLGAVLRSNSRRRTAASTDDGVGTLRRWALERLDGASVIAPAIAAAFLLSFGARAGIRWPPTMAWEWIAPAVAAAAAFAWLLPRRMPALIRLAPIFAGGVTAWALALPGFDHPWQRGAIGVAVIVVTAALAWSAGRDRRDTRAARASELLASSIALAGLALVVIAGAFETLTTTLLATALALAAASLVACVARTLRLGAAGGVTVGTLLVAGAATGAAYSSAGIPFWHWPVAVAAPPAALLVEFPWCPQRARPVLRVLIVMFVSIGNGAAALAPLIARGDFPPPV